VQISFYNFFSQCMHATKPGISPSVFTPFSSHPKLRLREELIKSPFSELSYSTPNNVDPFSPRPPRQLVGILATRGAGALRDEIADYHKSADIARGARAVSHITPDSWPCSCSPQSKTGQRVTTLKKKKIKFSSYIRKFIVEQSQSHIWGMASWYMRKCENISPYMRRPLVIYDFATAPLWMIFFFISVHM